MIKKIIGHCGVDSGQLIIVDPYYLREWRAGAYGAGDGNHYEEACQVTVREDLGGELLVAGIGGTGVAVSTGYGDGTYPVEALYENDRVREVRIKFF